MFIMSTSVPDSNSQTSDGKLVVTPDLQPLITLASDELHNAQAVQLSAALHTLLTEQGYPVDNVRLNGVIYQQQDLLALSSIISVLNQLGIEHTNDTRKC